MVHICGMAAEIEPHGKLSRGELQEGLPRRQIPLSHRLHHPNHGIFIFPDSLGLCVDQYCAGVE